VSKHKLLKLVDVNANMTIVQLQNFSYELTPHSFFEIMVSRCSILKVIDTMLRKVDGFISRVSYDYQDTTLVP
jgi:hypothetical protein